MFKRFVPIIIFICCCFFSQAQIANRFDVVIDEIMADPTPQIGLPNNEWIELRNTSATTFNLAGWKIGDATGQSGRHAFVQFKT
ncbi:MAG: lamin tail domain-containing protein [Ferruginibacter sp.]